MWLYPGSSLLEDESVSLIFYIFSYRRPQLRDFELLQRCWIFEENSDFEVLGYLEAVGLSHLSITTNRTPLGSWALLCLSVLALTRDCYHGCAALKSSKTTLFGALGIEPRALGTGVYIPVAIATSSHSLSGWFLLPGHGSSWPREPLHTRYLNTQVDQGYPQELQFQIQILIIFIQLS